MHFPTDYEIVKASGEHENFDEAKLVKSLANSGLSVDTASQTVDYFKRHLKSGISTHDIYHDVSGYLKENAPKSNYFNYNLKRAIMQLGPSGHPFEKLVSELLETMGFDCQVSVVLAGKCVSHEIDVIAVKGKDTFFIECKYHNGAGVKTDVQVSLYTYARFLDIESSMKARFGAEKDFHPWLVTNTKLTYDAIDYCECMNVHYTTWGLPKQENLFNLIMRSGLHPITVLDAIPESKMQELLSRDIVTCSTLKLALEKGSVSDIISSRESQSLLSDINLIIQKNV